VAQIVFFPKNKEVYESASRLRGEWVIRISGIVQRRPKGMENPNIVSGDFEIPADELQILAEAKTPPIAVDTNGTEIGEDLRMKYRYIDLRRERMKQNLIMRHRAIQFIRNFLSQRRFIEIETPILGKSTPEGARDYLVPARLHPGTFYALPQSPQQYKQLLMVAGIERYFQIARCFRDEDTRGDRQPEFTQLDVEMSFVSQEEILQLVEELFTSLVETVYPQKHFTFKPFVRLSYREVIEKYGTDKPDLRRDKNNPDELAFAFVVDFPMFEWKEKERRWDATHHPFTRPQQLGEESVDELRARLRDDTRNVLAHQYDFVCNGYEVGGGSIRTHEPDLLADVFKVMGHTQGGVEEKFGHLLEAFSYGVPPHGGIAPGIDRILMILQNEPNIREVIAFPKTGDGRDLLMAAPAAVDKKQLNELGVQLKQSKKPGLKQSKKN